MHVLLACPILLNPVIADYIQAYGQGRLKAKKLGVLDLFAEVYWYTVEFGLVEQVDGIRIYGAGIVSSYTESFLAVDDKSPNRIRSELERVMLTHYRIDNFQRSYFVIHSLDEVLDLANIEFGPVYHKVMLLLWLSPKDNVATDNIVSQGLGAYHSK